MKLDTWIRALWTALSLLDLTHKLYTHSPHDSRNALWLARPVRRAGRPACKSRTARAYEACFYPADTGSFCAQGLPSPYYKESHLRLREAARAWSVFSPSLPRLPHLGVR